MFSAGIPFKRQNLTFKESDSDSKVGPALKELNMFNANFRVVNIYR